MMMMMTTYSLVCQVEDLAIEEGCLPLLDGDHCLRVPKIWTRNKFVWGKWHVLDHHNLPSDWTEALNTLKCQTHRQNIFLECRNWFHFGPCQWTGWKQKYKSVYQENFHWEFFRYFVGNFWKWKISRKYLRAPTAYYLIHEGVEEKESRQVRFHFWAAGSGVGHRLKIDWNINQELLDIGDGGMYNVLPDISLIYLRTAKRGSIYIGKGPFPTGFILIIILSSFNSWYLDLSE